MGDFPCEWHHVRDLASGGQGDTFVVRRADGDDSQLYVLKRLKNLTRRDYFEREIKACTELDHPNILRVLSYGETPKGRPYLITKYCDGGSLRQRGRFHDPAEGMRFFQQITDAIEYAHSREPAVFHLDMKPENILIEEGKPILGDFGICFIDDEGLQMTSEGFLGSRYYCAPELRGPNISPSANPATADIYSLGKVLYWLFTGHVYDGHEEEYSGASERALSSLYKSRPEFAFIDELVAQMVQRISGKRIQTASALADRVRDINDRIAARGRVLDISTPKKCVFCAVGYYRAAHERLSVSPAYPGAQVFPDLETRKSPPLSSYPENHAFNATRVAAANVMNIGQIAQVRDGIPVAFVCDYCGNVQYFRLDLTADGHGDNWRP